MEYRISLKETKSKKIYLDPEGIEGIYLYPGEIKKSGLSDGMLLSERQIEDLRITYVLPRAKKRALGILVKRDKTIHELEQKLTESLYDSRSVREALSFVEEAGYVDDLEYARSYLRSKRGRKSFRMIRLTLSGKGIPEEILGQVFEEAGPQREEDVEPAVRKYARRFPQIDRTAREKICSHFYTKGYDPQLIRGILESEEFSSDLATTSSFSWGDSSRI